MIKIKLKGQYGEVEIERHPIDKYFSPVLEAYLAQAIIGYKALASEEKNENTGSD